MIIILFNHGATATSNIEFINQRRAVDLAKRTSAGGSKQLRGVYPPNVGESESVGAYSVRRPS